MVVRDSVTTSDKRVVSLVTTGVPSGPVHKVIADCVRPLAFFSAMQVSVYSAPAITPPVVEEDIRTVTGDGGTKIKRHTI